MARETDAEVEAAQKAALAAETAAHKAHLLNPSLVRTENRDYYSAGTTSTPPEIPASPTAQDVADVLVAFGLATQAEA